MRVVIYLMLFWLLPTLGVVYFHDLRGFAGGVALAYLTIIGDQGLRNWRAQREMSKRGFAVLPITDHEG
jgi:hypothetical protein